MTKPPVKVRYDSTPTVNRGGFLKAMAASPALPVDYDLVTEIEAGRRQRDQDGKATCETCGAQGHTTATHDMTPAQRRKRGHR